MAKRREIEKYLDKAWFRYAMALVSLLLAYWFVSLAINSGELWQYFACLVAFYWVIRHLVLGTRMLIHK